VIAAGAIALLAILAGEARAAVQSPQTGEIIAELRVHGNHITPDEEVVRIAGVTIGAPFGPTTIADVEARLRASDRFDSIEVLKRFASIEDPSRIVLVMIVNEGPVRIEPSSVPGEPPQILRRRGLRNLMFLPILDAEDGYGITYGARVAHAGLVGERSRVSFPLTWGGHKRAGVELDRTLVAGPFTRLQLGAAIEQRRNPAFDENDTRRRLWVRAERAWGPVRTGGTVGWQRVAFAGDRDDFRSIAVDAAFDTRLNPVLPRDAVYTSASVERLFFSGGRRIDRLRLDGRGYLGLFGQQVLVLRVVREDVGEPVPRYLRSLLGGWSTLRGFEAGAFTGDTLLAGSLELRIPLTSPLEIGKLGVSAFVDAGTAYDKGQRLADQTARTGIGGSAWMTIAAFRMSFSVAHGRRSGTRVNFGGGLTF
jgi:outer membrane protein assembly factor BamA